MEFFKPGESVVFKGCTRPATIMGVPMMPLFVVVSSIILLAFWTQIIPLVILVVPAIFILKFMAKEDDQQFNQLAVRLRTRRQNKNSKFWGRACSYQPCSYTRKLK